MDGLFVMMVWVFGISLSVAFLTALIGLFAKDDTARNKLYAISAKSALVCGLGFIVGFGSCLTMF